MVWDAGPKVICLLCFAAGCKAEEGPRFSLGNTLRSVDITVSMPSDTKPVAGAQLVFGETVLAESNGDGRMVANDMAAEIEIPAVARLQFGARSFEVALDERELEGDYPFPDDRVLGVVDGLYDPVSDVLDLVGVSYVSFASLAEVDSGAIDALVLPSGISEDWVSDLNGVGTQLASLSKSISIYASDWSVIALEQAFPDEQDLWGDDYSISNSRVGAEGPVQASAEQGSWADALLEGEDLEVVFPYDSWVVLVDSKAERLISADVATTGGNQLSGAPLVVTYSPAGFPVVATVVHSNPGSDPLVRDLEAHLLLSL